MHDLKLVNDVPVLRTVEPPSYYQYHAARTLPGDKKWNEYRKLLNRWYLAADVEDIVRGMIERNRTAREVQP